MPETTCTVNAAFVNIPTTAEKSTDRHWPSMPSRRKKAISWNKLADDSDISYQCPFRVCEREEASKQVVRGGGGLGSY